MAAGNLEGKIWSVLEPAVASRAYPFVVAAIAWFLTVTMTMPFAPILVGAIVLRRERWLAIVILSSIGSAAGGLLLHLAFHYLGWNEVVALYPDTAASKLWSAATRWVSANGAWTLLVSAALPLPQTPALALTAVSRLPAFEVFAALLCGKLLKYSVYGWLAARLSAWVQRFANSRGRAFPDENRKS